MEKLCEYCEKTFYFKPSRTNAKFCSHRCHSDFLILPKPTKKCIQCGKVFSSQGSANRVYCSYECSAKYKQGRNNPNWRGGKRNDHRGYIRVSVAPYKRRYEHVLIMEKHLGRRIKSNENVHHKNEIKHDNRLENLQILTIAEHTRLHATN